MAVEKMEFKTEVKELLNLMIHSSIRTRDLPARADLERLGRHRQGAPRVPDEQGIAEACGDWKIKITRTRKRKRSP